MKILRCAFVLLIGIVLISGLFVFWPQIRFRMELFHLVGRVEANAVPVSKSFSLDTYSDRISTADVEVLYRVGCLRLEELRGDFSRKTYRYEDEEGYMGVSSVVQYANRFVSVGVFGGNDSDIVMIEVAPGEFPASGESKAHYLKVEELPGDQLPRGVIRPW